MAVGASASSEAATTLQSTDAGTTEHDIGLSTALNVDDEQPLGGNMVGIVVGVAMGGLLLLAVVVVVTVIIYHR